MNRGLARWLRRFRGTSGHTLSAVAALDASAFEIECTSGGTGEARFRAVGALEDEGAPVGELAPASPTRSIWIGNRTLRGSKGMLFLFVDAVYPTAGSAEASGAFEILDGTEQYAGLRGSGAYAATVGPHGALVEVFRGRLRTES